MDQLNFWDDQIKFLRNINGIFLGCISDEQGVKSCVLLEYALSICKPVSASIHQNDIYYTFFAMPT